MKDLEDFFEKLGVESGKKFLATDGLYYKVESGQLFMCDREWLFASIEKHMQLLSGEVKPVWKPKFGEVYYTPNTMIPELVTRFTWRGGSIDVYRWEKGLVFDNEYDAYDCAVDMLSVIKE